jgi:N-acetylglucosamine-6-sulfatase
MVFRLLMLLALIGLLPWSSLAMRAATATPDLVLILADDMTDADWRSLPETRRLLPAVYPNFFLTQPLCCPSRATLLTGQYPHNHGTLRNNAGADAGWASFEDREGETLAVALQNGGYRTALIGKYLNHYPLTAGPRPGWDVWFATGDGGYTNYDIADEETVRHFGSAPKDYSTDVYRREAVRVIRQTPPDQPLFALVAPTAPHGPAKVADGYQGTCDGERVPRTPNLNAKSVGKPPYLQDLPSLSRAELDAFEQNRQCSLKSVDDLTVEIVKALEARDRPFCVVFMSDNGYLLGQHRFLGKNVPYEEATRVTMRAVGRGFATGVHKEITGNIDLAPTFAALGGVQLTTPDGFDLRSNERQTILLEAFGGETAEEGDSTTQRGPSAQADLPNPPQPPPWSAVRSNTAIYIETTQNGDVFREFYDLRHDPYQLDNVAGSDPRVSDYAAALSALRGCTGQACNRVEVRAGA